MASSTYDDNLLLAFGNLLRQRELKEAQWAPEILDSTEVEWISYQTAQDDFHLLATAKELLALDGPYFDKVGEELEAMHSVWQGIKTFKRQVRELPRDRHMLECFVICFYVISHRANLNIDHLSERLNQLGGRFPMRPRSGIPIGRVGERSDREGTTEQAGSPGFVVIASDLEELDESSLDDYKTDSYGDKPGGQISAWPVWKPDASSPDDPDKSDYKPDVESDESSDKSDEELRYNRLSGEAAGPRKRKADDATVENCKRSRLGYILN